MVTKTTAFEPVLTPRCWAITISRVGCCAALVGLAALACQGASRGDGRSTEALRSGGDASEAWETAAGATRGETLDAGVSAYVLCDGSTDVRFAGAGLTSQGDYKLARAWGLHYDWYVVVTGKCEVWARIGLLPVRASLSAAEAAELTGALRFGEWSTDWRSGGTHESVNLLADGEGRTLACAVSGCNVSAGDEVSRPRYRSQNEWSTSALVRRTLG